MKTAILTLAVILVSASVAFTKEANLNPWNQVPPPAVVVYDGGYQERPLGDYQPVALDAIPVIPSTQELNREICNLVSELENQQVPHLQTDSISNIKGTIKIGVDIDFLYFQRLGGESIDQTLTKVFQTVAEGNQFFYETTGVWLQITTAIVRTTPRYDYGTNASGITSVLFNTLRDEWRTVPILAREQYSLVHLFSGHTSSYGTVGGATFTSACNSTGGLPTSMGRYWYAQPGFPTKAGALFAHEVGHNFGLGHCDSLCSACCDRSGQNIMCSGRLDNPTGYCPESEHKLRDKLEVCHGMGELHPPVPLNPLTLFLLIPIFSFMMKRRKVI